MEFEYIAIDKDGKRIKSSMVANSPAVVADIIRDAGGKPVKITPLKKKNAGFGQIFAPRKHVASKELVVFTRQLGSILGAGVLLSHAIDTIAFDLENQYFADVLKDVLSRIHAGEVFSTALANHPKVFSPYYVAIVRSGEEIGA